MPPESEHLADDALSDREIDVLRSVAAGNSNKLIAERLAILCGRPILDGLPIVAQK